MVDPKYKELINSTVDKLVNADSLELVYHKPNFGHKMPSRKRMNEVVELIKAVIFPGYFGSSKVEPCTLQFYTGVAIDQINSILKSQINRGLCFVCENAETLECQGCDNKAEKLAAQFIEKLPKIREMLAKDVEATYYADPASKSYGEIIFAYPGITAITNYRIAHELLNLGVPLLPRIIAELSHSETGIDIHPRATIGEYFTIDHGTGIVVGATCIIGNHVTLYQGVTLGAKSFPVDDDGNPVKGIPRHPIVEDNVTVYSGATILGRITIGKGTMIGGNVWLTNSVPANSKIIQHKPKEVYFADGAGI